MGYTARVRSEYIPTMKSMRRGVVALFAVGVAATVLAGCSSGGGSNTAAPPPSGLDTTSSAAPATTSEQGQSSKPIQKRVGELAGLGCKAGETNCVDLLDFTVTDISTARGCSAEPASGKRFLHVALSASVSPDIPQDKELAAGTLLNTSNWQVVGADGFSSTNLDVATSCEFDAGPFYQQVAPGTKQRGDIAFTVPADARQLQLRPSVSRAGWTWDVPAA